MGQIFHRSTNSIARFSIFATVVAVGGLLWFFAAMQRSPYYMGEGVAPAQPVPFSHQHHVSGLGIDCRYCHTSVEVSGFAGIPPTKTCINCHAQIWSGAAMLEPVRESFKSGRSLVWTRVYDLPDYVYFDHSIHINKGVGCASCHGRIDNMPLTNPAEALTMEWCLSCHREPEKNLRPRDQVFNMRYEQPSGRNPVEFEGKNYTDQIALGNVLKDRYHLRSVADITSCSTCHR